MKFSRYIATLVAGYTCAFSPEIFAADDSALTHTVKATLDICEIYVRAGQPVAIQFESPILETDAPSRWKVRHDIKPGSDMIALDVPSGVKADDLNGQMLVLTRNYLLYVKATGVDDDSANATPNIVRVEHLEQVRQLAERLARKLMAEELAKHARELAARDADHADEVRRLEQRIKQLTEQLNTTVELRAEQAIVRGLVDGHVSVPINQKAEGDRGMLLSGLEWVKSGERNYLRFTLENRRDAKYPIATLELQDASGKDYAGTVQIGLKQRASEGELLADLKPWEIMLGSVAVSNLQALGANAKLVINGPGVEAAFRIIPIDPPREPDPTDRELRATQVIVGVTGAFGALWLTDGQGEGQLDATSFKGLGLRVIKGFFEEFAVEVELAGAWSGEAQFSDITIDDTAGVLTRSALLGRAGFGGLLRFGDAFNPFLRLGIGVQAVSLDSKFIVDGMTGPGPDAPFELRGYFQAGGGVDIRLNHNLVAGAVLTFISAPGSVQQSFNAGIHLSYGWNP